VAVVVSVTPQILVSRASSRSARKKHKATAVKVATRQNSSNSTKKQNTKQHQRQSTMSSFAFDEDMTEVDTFPAVFDILAFTTDSFINALVDDTDQRHEFAHVINERVIFCYRYNHIALELFDLSIVPVEDSHVALTEVYALSK
jgi:hypothetical protein